VRRGQQVEIELMDVDRPCGLCRSSELVVTETRPVRGPLSRLNPVFHPEIRLFEVCRRCGARQLLVDAQAA